MYRLLISLCLLVICSIECKAQWEINEISIEETCIGEGRAGICVLLSECPPLIAEITEDALDDGRPMPVELPAILLSLGCGFEGYEPKVCCPSGVVEAPDIDIRIGW